MNSNAFDAITRHAGVHSRRGSLRALGGAALATTLAAPANARARKGGKKKNANKQCKKQKAQCVAVVTAFCAKTGDPALCESVYLPCCKHFTGCSVEAGITCIIQAD
jgi:hypothetical protein